MAIRRAWVADCEAIKGLLEQLGYPRTLDQVREKLNQLIINVEDEVYVYQEDNKTLGFITLHYSIQLGFDGDFCEIGYLVVDESIRSKGVGNELEEYACFIAKKRGCSKIHVFSRNERVDAHRFYERQGYLPIEAYFEKDLS